MKRLLAISDLHVGFERNRVALAGLPAQPADGLIVCGDVGESEELMELALSILVTRFEQVFWVPGNHELWLDPRDPLALRGEAKYRRLVELCRRHGAKTPEDPFETWTIAGESHVIAPMFLLYDYSFRPDEVALADAVAWAEEAGIRCADEDLLYPDPYPTRQAWCEARCIGTERRLQELDPALPLVLANHFPLRQDLIHLSRIPRFSMWCGTKRTEDWHVRYRAKVVISGHLHMRSTQWRDGVRFEEVSLGYPRQWRDPALASYLREIVPGPQHPAQAGVQWRW